MKTVIRLVHRIIPQLSQPKQCHHSNDLYVQFVVLMLIENEIFKMASVRQVFDIKTMAAHRYAYRLAGALCECAFFVQRTHFYI